MTRHGKGEKKGGTVKIVINKCYGGFGLSPAAVKRMAELQGRECYFYVRDKLATQKEAEGTMFFNAFDVPNFHEISPDVSGSAWAEMTPEEKSAHNALYDKHKLTTRPDDRTDPILVQVVEELGARASGSCAKLSVVEVPAGVDWEIDEYDGIETVREKSRSWPAR